VSRTLRRITYWGALLLIAVLIWQLLLPPKLGGKTTFLTTDGKSMEPILHTGDLALLRKQSQYKVGDVIEYKAKSLNIMLLHRIVSIDGQGITTQGDNNGFTDLDHPTNKEIVGKMVYHKAGGGKYIHIASSMPVRLIGALLLGWAVYNIFGAAPSDDTKPSRLRRRLGLSQAQERVARIRETAKDSGVNMTPAAARVAIKSGDNRTIIRTFGTILAISLIVTGFAFTQPLVTTRQADVIYSYKGKFNYSAGASGSDLIYSDGQVQTGDPVYLNVVKEVFVTYNVAIDSPARFKGTGDVSMIATVKGASGWTHTLPIKSTAKLSDGQARVSAVIDFGQILDLVNQANKLTKLKDASYRVTLSPTLHVDGTLGGARLMSNYTSQYTFVGNATKVTVASDATPGTGKKSPTDTANDPTNGGGTLKVPKSTPAKIGALGLGVGVAAVRAIGLGGIVIGLAGLAYAAVNGGLRRREEREDVPLPEDPLQSESEEDLLAAARNQFEQMVTSPDGDTTYVQRPAPSAEDRFGASRETSSTRGEG
jgi:signal peptidase I